ncbi:MAG: acetylornithine/succinylornithine family transaminase [Deltaproteobacteria bacterium]|jgi:predicted acetylornithine/succinylornithine family transaminase|nr:acetylornithine/succinylornithine family transaminase [Deltaproteobacteria bacterium]
MSFSSKEIIALADQYLLGNVSRVPLVLVKGQGSKVWDAEGREYLDFIAGVATCAFGHSPAFMADILAEQARKLVHVSNIFYNEPQVLLAERLVKASGLSKAFFSNSGAEANEAALKMARKYSHDRYGAGRHVIVSALDSFHGRTMGAISATGQTRFHQGFEPMLPGFKFVRFGDVAALKEALTPDVCAVLLEPIQGEGGVNIPPADYFSETAKLCQSKDILLILDEVQTGLGRTGQDFAFRHFNVKPDILTLGKALGSGYPVGATLSAAEPSKALSPGTHSSTVGGAPLAMTISLELVNRILEPSFLAEVAQKGVFFKKSLEDLKAARPKDILDVRGLGLILGLSLNRPSGPVVAALRDLGFLVNAASPTILRFVPPLTVTNDEISQLTQGLLDALDRSAA